MKHPPLEKEKKRKLVTVSSKAYTEFLEVFEKMCLESWKLWIFRYLIESSHHTCNMKDNIFFYYPAFSLEHVYMNGCCLNKIFNVRNCLNCTYWPNPSARYDTCSILSRLIQNFSFSYTSWITKAIEPSLP